MTGLLQYAIQYIFLIIFTALGAAVYYKSKDKINGFILGIFWVLVGNVLDLIITVSMFTAKQFVARIFNSDNCGRNLWLSQKIVFSFSFLFSLFLIIF